MEAFTRFATGNSPSLRVAESPNTVHIAIGIRAIQRKLST